uniref:Uncharacterized protein n=1 Tax=Pararge aegeria TaxID=116150 RepID=S4P1V4_9NEOP
MFKSSPHLFFQVKIQLSVRYSYFAFGLDIEKKKLRSLLIPNPPFLHIGRVLLTVFSPVAWCGDEATTFITPYKM